MGEHEQALASSSDDETDVPTRKRGLRGMLLQYMLYDAFIRPQSWAFATLNNDRREQLWRTAIQRVCGETSGGVYVISNASELPSVPIFAASVIRDDSLPSRFVNILEPRRPIAAALRACLKENNFDGLTRVIPASATVFQPNRKAGEDAPGGIGKVLLVPGVEDIATLGSALEDVKDAHDNILAADAKVLPQSVSIRAIGLTVPAQTDLVRAPLGTVSGFDLSPFNKFRGEAPVDLIRLRDIKSRSVTAETEVMNISLEKMSAVGELLHSSRFEVFELDMQVISDGKIDAIALWTDCMMFDEVHSGGADQPSRRQMVSFLQTPLSVCEGSTVRLTGRYDASTGHFKFVSSECSVESHQLNSVVSMSVERWHFPMINDERRNSAYNRAIDMCLKGQRVVDIGGGSGLLAMMAARAGAEQVVTVERVGDMAECASRVLESNGFGNKIAVVHGSSLNLKVPDLGFKGDLRPTVVLSEVLDDGLLGEGVIPTVAHARRELAAPNAMVIPAAAKVWAMVVHMPPQAEPIIMPSSSAPNDSPARRWAAYDTLRPPEVKKYTSVRLDRVKFTPLTEPFPVFGFDFDAPLDDPSSAADFCREQDVQVNSIATGCANAVVFWFTLTLNRSEENGLADICTYPAMTEQCGAASSSRCWNEALQFVKPVFVEATGTTLTVPCAHSPTRVTFGDIIT